MSALFSTAQVRQVEAAAAAMLPVGTLMERAGIAATDSAIALAGPPSGARVLVLAGPGNNGGDALEVAARLAGMGARVDVIDLGAGCERSPEARTALERARASNAAFVQVADGDFSLVIDGMFGIGIARPLSGQARELAAAVSSFGCPVLALDVPSGLDAETGAVIGPDGLAVAATHTITFICDKPGLRSGEGVDYAGEVTVATLGIDPSHLPEAAANMNGPALFQEWLRPRARNSHKGSFGDVAVLGGAQGMAGAVLLAARAALLTGAGRVYAAFIGDVPPLDPLQPEIMCRYAGTMETGNATLVAGPGMGKAPDAARLLLRVLESAGPVVLDADALNLISASSDLQQRLAARGNAILTPHPLEAARLLGMTGAIVQADRLAAAHELASRFNATVILKGAGSVIASGTDIVINGSGNPGLATAGSGDVLAGMCGSLLAQGWPVREAALGAAWVHGQAADDLVAQGKGPIGLTAGELPAAARSALNGLVERYGRRRS